MCCAVVLLPMSILMSSLFEKSAQFQRNMLPYVQLIADKQTRKQVEGQLKACSLIRCQVGSLYHMEAKAKLTMLSHVISGVVFLLVNVRV